MCTCIDRWSYRYLCLHDSSPSCPCHSLAGFDYLAAMRKHLFEMASADMGAQVASQLLPL